MNTQIQSFSKDFQDIINQCGNQTLCIQQLEVDPKEYTYKEMDALTCRVAHFLASKGVRTGDTLEVMLPNTIENIVVLLACLRAGINYAPVSCEATSHEVAQNTRILHPRLILITDLLPNDILSKIENGRPDVIRIKCDTEFTWLTEDNTSSVTTDSVSKIYIRTSGTSGEPKLMVIDADKLWSSGLAFSHFHKIETGGARFWNYLPMSYLGGLFNLTLIPIACRGSFVIDNVFSGQTSLRFWHTVERFDINHLWFVPTIVKGLLSLAKNNNRTQFSKLSQRVTRAFLGTAKIDLASKTAFEDMFHFTLLENFALSETTFITSETADNIKSRSEGSVGEVLPYIDLKIDSETKELKVKSPFLFEGYLDEKGLTPPVFDEEGYFSTGDLGESLGPNIVINGRNREIIKKGGYMVSLTEIERIAEGLSMVKEAAAVATPHKFYGESFQLFVLLAEGSDTSMIPKISKELHSQLVKYKWPDRVTSVNEFPRTASGKIQKSKLI